MATYRELQEENNKIVPIPENFRNFPKAPENNSGAYINPYRALTMYPNLGKRNYSKEAAAVGYGESMYDDISNLAQLSELNNIRGENQTTIHKWASGIAKMGTLALTTLADNYLGLAYGLVNTAGQLAQGNIQSFGDAIDAFVDNPVSRFLQGINNKMEEWAPNYYIEEEQNKPWYQKLGTANFWADHALKNTGFLIGAAVSGAGAGKALTKLTKLDKARDIFKGLATTYDDAVKAGKSIGSLDDILKAQKTMANDIAKKELTVKLGSGIMSSIGESRIEALNGKDEFVNSILPNIEQARSQALENINYSIAEERPDLVSLMPSIKGYDSEGNPLISMEYGIKPGKANEYRSYYNSKVTDINNKYTEAIGELDKQAQNYSNSAFALNMLVTGPTNMKLFGNAILGNYNLSKKVLSIAKESGVKEGVKAGFKNTRAASTRELLSGISAPFAESLQETSQKTITESMDKWYGNKFNTWYGSTMTPEAIDEQVSIMRTMWDTFSGIATDPDEWEDGFLGFITALLPLPGAGVDSKTGKKKVTWSNELIEKIQSAKKIKTEGDALATALNDLMSDEKKMAFVAGNIRAGSIEKDKTKALENEDSLAYENALSADQINTILTFVDAGQVDELYKWIDTAYTITEDSIDDLKANTKVKGTEQSPFDGKTNAEILDYFNKQKEVITNKAKTIVSISESVDAVYGERLSKQGKLELTNLLATLDDRNYRLRDNTKKLTEYLNANRKNLANILSEEEIKDLESLTDVQLYLDSEDTNAIATLDTKEAIKVLQKKYDKAAKRRQSLYGKRGSIISRINKLESKLSDGTITDSEKRKLSSLKGALHGNSANRNALGRVINLLEELKSDISNTKDIAKSLDMESTLSTIIYDLVGNKQMADVYKTLSSDPTIIEESLAASLVDSFNHFVQKKTNRIYDDFKQSRDFNILKDENLGLGNIKEEAKKRDDIEMQNWISVFEKLKPLFEDATGNPYISDKTPTLNSIIYSVLNSGIDPKDTFKNVKQALEANKDAIIAESGENLFNILLDKVTTRDKTEKEKPKNNSKRSRVNKDVENTYSENTNTDNGSNTNTKKESIESILNALDSLLERGNDIDILELVNLLDDIDKSNHRTYESLIAFLNNKKILNSIELEEDESLLNLDESIIPENVSINDILNEIKEFFNSTQEKNRKLEKEESVKKKEEPEEKEVGSTLSEPGFSPVEIKAKSINKQVKTVETLPEEVSDDVLNIGTSGISYDTSKEGLPKGVLKLNNLKSNNPLVKYKVQEFLDSGKLAELQKKHKGKLPVKIIMLRNKYYLAVDYTHPKDSDNTQLYVYDPVKEQDVNIQIIGSIKADDLPKKVKDALKNVKKERKLLNENAFIFYSNHNTTLEYIFSGRIILQNKMPNSDLTENTNRNLMDVLDADGIETNDEGEYEDFDIVVTEDDGSINPNKVIGKEGLFDDVEVVSLNNKRYLHNIPQRGGLVWLRSKAPNGKVYLKAVTVNSFNQPIESSRDVKEGTIQYDILSTCEDLFNIINEQGDKSDIIEAVNTLSKYLYFKEGLFVDADSSYIRIGNNYYYIDEIEDGVDIYNIISDNSPVYNLPITKDRKGESAPSLNKLVESGVFITNLASIKHYGASFAVSKIDEEGLIVVPVDKDYSQDLHYRLYNILFNKDTGGYNTIQGIPNGNYIYLFKTNDAGEITELGKRRKLTGSQRVEKLSKEEELLAKFLIYKSTANSLYEVVNTGVTNIKAVYKRKKLQYYIFGYKDNLQSSETKVYRYYPNESTISDMLEFIGKDEEALIDNTSEENTVTAIEDLSDEYDYVDEVDEESTEDNEYTEDEDSEEVDRENSENASKDDLEEVLNTFISKTPLFNNPVGKMLLHKFVNSVLVYVDGSNSISTAIIQLLNRESPLNITTVDKLKALENKLICYAPF